MAKPRIYGYYKPIPQIKNRKKNPFKKGKKNLGQNHQC